MTDINWDDRYKGEAENRPWDVGKPEPELESCVKALKHKPKHALEIGCGTGTNAVWLAQQGIEVVGTDLSPTAIDAAKQRAESANVKVDFKVGDICAEAPVSAGWADFVFDRGVFHVMASQEQTKIFADRVADALAADGLWFCMAGSKDEKDMLDKGPPKWSATEIASVVEPKFEIKALNKGRFSLPDGSQHLAWLVLMRKR